MTPIKTPFGGTLEFYPLPDTSGKGTVLICPGGGYSFLAEREGRPIADAFNQNGYSAAILNYCLDRDVHGTNPVKELAWAVRYLRTASEWNGLVHKLWVSGFSAGGHLASSVSTHAEAAVRPDFSILFYPVISMDERISHKGSCVNFLGEERNTDKKLVEEWSNDKAVRPNLTPRAIILMSFDDKVVPPVTNGVAYYSAMSKAGNECTMHIYPTAGHGWGFRDAAHGFPYHDQMLNDLTCWLNRLPSK